MRFLHLGIQLHAAGQTESGVIARLKAVAEEKHSDGGAFEKIKVKSYISS
jgi:hypothetical protein